MKKNASGLDNSTREIMIARVIFAITVLIGGAFFVNIIIKSGVTPWLIFFILVWLTILWRFWFNIVKGSLTLTFMLGYFFLAIVISVIALSLATPPDANKGPNNNQTVTPISKSY